MDRIGGKDAAHAAQARCARPRDISSDIAPDPAPASALAALLGGGLRLALQPVRPLAAPGLVAFHEALARVPGPDGAMISAGRFAGALEARGLAPLLDRAALEGGLALLTQDRAARISVNVSARTVGDLRWMRRLEAAAEADPDAVRRLVVELTETAVAPMPEARRFRDRVGRAGPAFALDDFGSGHADAALASALAPDILKLDAGLCAARAGVAGTRRVAEATALAARLDAMTVGEGVETAEDAARLADLGVDAAQGWWFGRPSLAAAAA
ncbi:MAG: EAL domain-containing protein [Pseudomonadota bacterium]|nr:EAL domain-containing protein [Pseudomonadota bacterium]MEE3101163.1 EAL domain-containing protein [Pseudomonadota bacterium]